MIRPFFSFYFLHGNVNNYLLLIGKGFFERGRDCGGNNTLLPGISSTHRKFKIRRENRKNCLRTCIQGHCVGCNM